MKSSGPRRYKVVYKIRFYRKDPLTGYTVQYNGAQVKTLLYFEVPMEIKCTGQEILRNVIHASGFLEFGDSPRIVRVKESEWQKNKQLTFKYPVDFV